MPIICSDCGDGSSNVIEIRAFSNQSNRNDNHHLIGLADTHATTVCPCLSTTTTAKAFYPLSLCYTPCCHAVVIATNHMDCCPQSSFIYQQQFSFLFYCGTTQTKEQHQQEAVYDDDDDDDDDDDSV